MSDHFVVTGAGQGIGAAIARRFARAYPTSSLSLLARNEERLRGVAGDCSNIGASVHIYPCDVTDSRAVASACRALLGDSGTPTVCVNNAGAFQPGGILDTTPEQFRQQLDVNLTGAFLVTSNLVPKMISAGSGHVIFIASVASIRGYPSGIAYCASKHGLLGLARALREETKQTGIRVTSLLPGATYTASWQGSGVTEDRLMPAEDIAEAVLAAHQMSKRTVVEEMILRPQLGDV